MSLEVKRITETPAVNQLLANRLSNNRYGHMPLSWFFCPNSIWIAARGPNSLLAPHCADHFSENRFRANELHRRAGRSRCVLSPRRWAEHVEFGFSQIQ